MNPGEIYQSLLPLQQLRQFYSEWLMWAENGAEDHSCFDRRYGLCRCLTLWCKYHDLDSISLLTRMRVQFRHAGLDTITPFSDILDFQRESYLSIMHENKARLAWARSQVQAGTYGDNAEGEKILAQFYQQYRNWLDIGAPDDKPFDRAFGLCSNLDRWLTRNDVPCEYGVAALLRADFRRAGLDDMYPFNPRYHLTDKTYQQEVLAITAYRNKARIQWIHDRTVEQLPKVRGFWIRLFRRLKWI